MSNIQKTINTEKYNEWVKKFSEQVFKITGDEIFIPFVLCER